MVDITQKSYSLRQAIASSVVSVSKQETIDAVRNRTVPKGDVFEISRAAGLLAVKKTSEVIPDCHPLPVEYAAITHKIDGKRILITVEVKTIYKTGVEVEAMHGAAITALTIYDMLKPLDPAVEISSIKLESKKGGKTDYFNEDVPGIKCAVIVCSDSISKDRAKDTTGKAIIDKLTQFNLSVEHYEVIADEISEIQENLKNLSTGGYQLVVFTGGTGVSPRDVTPEAVAPLLDKDVPGIMEAARNYGQQRTPFAMLSRGVAGFIKNTLVITLPGSTKGAIETLDAIFPQVLHVFRVARGERHD